MKDTEQRCYEMLVRVSEYGTRRSADFPAETLGGQLFASLREEIIIIETKAREQSSGFSAKRQATATRSIARESLLGQMEAIGRTAAALALSGIPGLEDRFRMPRNNNDQLFITTARAFAEDALPIKGRFIGFGLPADFLDNLNAAITEFERAINRQNSGRDMHVAATTAIDEALGRALNIVRQLDAIVRNKYADNAPQLSAWESARHIQRSPQRAAEEEEEPAA